ncbi:NAD(P)-dependent oxidoreductase [Flavobacterium sp. CYK-55]|uniref:NAD-dependent epimerase/dehydratase family protein n=1 Tax=Flavobacterium sp. CYK-55 TaxID=2835529 RepID=UPI001BD0D36B|nr:NAD(P)-dependent oxidoreductase [Flavobacterium sp. CYK-55]MBS7786427.1 NAD(P)-dependent oxidoreductase [Flavobacterium sp. CYK-55]
MKILVTGGAGFIGSAIVPKMQKEGHDVFVLDNLSFGSRAFISVDDAHFFEGDIRDADFVNKTFDSVQPDAIVHLAAIHFIPYCNANPFESADINIRGTMNILDAARKIKNLKKVFFASTAAVYPISDHAVDENHTLLPLDIYGLTKLTGERLCSEFHLSTGIDTICCRFFNAFGPNETNPHLIPEIEKQLRNGARTIALGNLAPKRDFIHTFDMANAVYALVILENTGYDTFNLGRGIEYSVTEIVATFEELLGEKITVEIDPARTRKVERMHLLANVDKLKTRTGWSPNWSIEEGIKDLIDNWK